MNVELQKSFAKDEIKEALFQMAPLKSLNPNGFNASSYLRYQHIVEQEVCSIALKFLNERLFDEKINFTYIVLIPKIKSLGKASGYRPISLCNVMYKILSKVLANRLKKVLPVIISNNQSAFIPKRLISDNVIVAYEGLHSQ